MTKRKSDSQQTQAEPLVRIIRPEDLGFGRLFNHLSDAVIVLDAETGLIILWNEGAEALFGYTSQEAGGMLFEDLLPADQRALYHATLDAYLGPGAPTHPDRQAPRELRALARDGRELAVDLTLSHITDTDVPGAFVLALLRDISERSRVSQALKSSEGRWKALVESAAESVVEVDRKYVIRFANHLPLDPEHTVIGRSLFDFIPPEDRERVKAIYDRVFAEGLPDRFETRGVGPTGASSWYQSSIGPLIVDGRVESVVVISHDVSELRRALEALRASQQQLAKAQALAHLGNWEWDVASDRLSWSAEMFRMFGEDPKTFEAGMKARLKSVHPEDAEMVREKLASARATGEPLVLEYRTIQPDGSIRYLQSRAEAERDVEGRLVRFIGTVQDVSELKQAFAELDQRNDELRRALELDHLKSSFVNSVSHELRTPLTSIVGYAEFLEDEVGGPVSSDQREFVEEILKGARRLERLVDDLLDFARIDAGTFRLRLEDVDLAKKAAEIVTSLQPQALTAQLKLELKVPETPVTARMDPQRIGQVITNLLSNAIKFTPEGGRVSVSVSAEGDQVRAEVTDTGPGIAEEDRPRLFQRFSQLENSRRKGGAGLGLSISKALVEAHSGQIGVESQAGQGATFWFTLPVAGPDDPGPQDS